MLGADTNNQSARVNRKSDFAKKYFLKKYSTSEGAVEPQTIFREKMRSGDLKSIGLRSFLCFRGVSTRGAAMCDPEPRRDS